MPNEYVNKVTYGDEVLLDLTGDTATAADVAVGKTFHLATGAPATGTASGGHAAITGTYDSATKRLTLDTEGVIDAWWGGIEPEFLYEARCTLHPTDAANWPITPTTSAQSLTWTTSYTQAANANAVFDRYGSGYHDGEALDYGQYGYVWLCSGFTNIAYTVDEATMGQFHVINNAFETVMHYGARPRVASGAIVYPTPTTYGSYGNTNTTTLMCYYRNASNVILLANNATYGVGLAAIAPQQQSTSSVKPTYANFRYPTVSIRANDNYMPVAAYSYVDWANTTVEYRCRLYRVPVEYALYTAQNDRIVRNMILGHTFPVELV